MNQPDCVNYSFAEEDCLVPGCDGKPCECRPGLFQSRRRAATVIVVGALVSAAIAWGAVELGSWVFGLLWRAMTWLWVASL